jgi:hypothetical protein
LLINTYGYLQTSYTHQQGKIKYGKGEFVNTCPLEWWRLRKDSYPILSRLARIYFGVQTTSASSERIFSKDKRVIAKKRTNLDPERADTLIWLAGILKQEEEL